MNNVIDSLPERYRETFVQVLEERDSALLAQLRAQEKPTLEQADTVNSIFARAVMANFGPSYDEPTELAVDIEDTIAGFWNRWPRDTLGDS